MNEGLHSLIRQVESDSSTKFDMHLWVIDLSKLSIVIVQDIAVRHVSHIDAMSDSQVILIKFLRIICHENFGDIRLEVSFTHLNAFESEERMNFFA